MSERKRRALVDMQSGTFGRGGEIIDWTYYDSGILAVATLVHRLFTVPLGGGAPAKTLDRTNMTTAGQMPQGQRLRSGALRLWIVSAAALGTAAVQLFYDMLRQSTLEIVVPGQDVLGQWTLAEILGASTLLAITPTVAGDNLPVIMPRYTGVKVINVPIVLSALTPFEVRITHHVAVNVALANMLIYAGISGRLQRSN